MDLNQYGTLIIDPILNKPICRTCKKDPKYKQITPSSFERKYKINKKYLEDSQLKYITAPNPLFKFKPMKLYYEF